MQKNFNGPTEAGLRISTPLLFVVLAATAMAYVWTLHFGFVYDDLGQIVANPLVQSWRFVPLYFHGNVWMQQSPVGNYYRPLFLLWLLLNYTLFGLHPAFWHLTTVIAHMAATALVYLLALRLTRQQKVAAITALVFGIHPAHVESVAWISGVTDALLALLLIPAFLAYLTYREKRESKWLVISMGLYAGSLLAKETAVVLPVLAVVYILLCPHQEWKAKFRHAALIALAFTVVTIPYLFLRAAALRGIAHRTVNIPASISLYTMPSVLWLYIKHLVAPFPLSAFYDTPYVTHVTWHFFLAPLVAVLITVLVLLIAWLKSGSPMVLFSAAWIFVPLLPVLDLSVLPMGDFVHDRYLYLPLIGFGLLLGTAFAALDAKKRSLGTVVACALAAVLTVMTVVNTLPWIDDIPLYEHGMKVAPINDIPRDKLAATFVARGMYRKGIAAYKFVLANDPDYWYANYRMGYAQFMLGRFDAAEPYLEKAASEEGAPEVLYYLGLNATRVKRYDLAEKALREAIQRNPQAPGLAFALGMTMKDEGKLEPALEWFRLELRRNPGNPAARAQIEELTAKLHPPAK